MSGKVKRRRADRRGLWAERWAALWLGLKGYRILARRWRVRSGEIDLIARKGRTIVFVEVKARHKLSAAAESVTARQRHRVMQAARAFLARHPGLTALDRRFDVMLVTRWRPPAHIPDAWQEGDESPP